VADLRQISRNHKATHSGIASGEKNPRFDLKFLAIGKLIALYIKSKKKQLYNTELTPF
jgi:hypothetical protein